MWKEIAIGLSFVNLCYLRVWSEVLTYTPGQSYEMRLPPGPHDYLAACLNVIVGGVLVGLVSWRLRGTQRQVIAAGRWVFLLLLLVPMNALRAVLAGTLPVGQQYLKGGLYAALGPLGLSAVGGMAAASGAWALHRRRERLFRAARTLVLMLTPLVPMTLLEAAWMAHEYDPAAFADQAVAGRVTVEAHENDSLVGQPRRRVVWVIFDEWDQRLSFADRPRDLALPAIDEFRAQSLVAAKAYPPASNTLESMPSLISGHTVTKAVAAGPARLLLTLDDRPERVDWRVLPNVFARARALGFDTALSGVYHPYCRVLARSLTSCWWSELPRPINSNGESLAEAIAGQTRSLFESWRLSLFGQSLSARRKARDFPDALEHAKQLAADPSYALVLIHLLTPHFPHAYDRATGEFTLGNAPLRGYYDSLALTDRAWAALRRAMEQAGTWTTTTVLLSSDHALRHARLLDGKSDPRVPFLLKLAGQTERFDYDAPFATVLSGELLLDVLRDRVREPRQVALWLDAHRLSPAEGPRPAVEGRSD